MSWPAPPPGHEDDPELRKILLQAEADAELARRREAAEQAAAEAALGRELQKSAQATEDELAKAVHAARLEIGKTAIDRGIGAAEFIRNAAAAIVTLYTGVLGVAFATGEDSTPLPARGIVPAVFLGLAITCAAGYVALLAKADQTSAPKPHSSLPIFQERRLNAFIEWTSKIALDRVRFLHSAVLSLGLGVLLLPVAFVDISDLVAGIVAVAGLLVVYFGPANKPAH